MSVCRTIKVFMRVPVSPFLYVELKGTPVLCSLNIEWLVKLSCECFCVTISKARVLPFLCFLSSDFSAVILNAALFTALRLNQAKIFLVLDRCGNNSKFLRSGKNRAKVFSFPCTETIPFSCFCSSVKALL